MRRILADGGFENSIGTAHGSKRSAIDRAWTAH